MSLIDKYLEYIANVRRYSRRTQEIYAEVLKDFTKFAIPEAASPEQVTDLMLKESLTPLVIRGYEMNLLDERGLSPRTVNLHISVLSGLCRFLMKTDILTANPAKAVSRPKQEKRLPVFYRKDAMAGYFAESDIFAGEDILTSPEEFMERYTAAKSKPGYRIENDPVYSEMSKLAEKPDRFAAWLFEKRLKRAIVSTLYATGIRRSELVSLRRDSIDFDRRIMRVTGKGDKTREIPLVPSLCKEISLYLQAVEATVCGNRQWDSPLFVTSRGTDIYPEYVDRAVKSELEGTEGFTARKSPHVLRHTLATELLEDGTDLNSIKELLGHSSLAATQVYTHNTIAKLKKVYETAHPRAKSGGKHGD